MVNINTIRNICRVKKYPRGMVISEDTADCIMFVILKGEVGVYTNYRQPNAEMIRTLGAGDLFADPGLLLDKHAVYTTVSLSDGIILPIERKTVIEFIQEEPDLTFELIRELFLRFEQLSAAHKALIVRHDAERRAAARGAGTAEVRLSGSDGGADAPHAAPIPHGAAPNDAVSSLEARGEELAALRWKLFPPEHGTYALPEGLADRACLMEKTCTCPACRNCFTTSVIKPSRLSAISSDSDLRVHYSGIEPLYFEVLTCPHCLYSALADVFDIPDKPRQDIMGALHPLQGAFHVSPGPERDAASVFTGYYLALYCAPVSFNNYQLIEAKLLLKLSRVYSDVGDKAMESVAARRALDNYLYAYARIGVPPAQEQQVCILIGELYLKQGDLKNALSFLNRARSVTGPNPALRGHAEKRAAEVRELIELQK